MLTMHFTSCLAAFGAALILAPATLSEAQCDCPAEAIEAVGHRGTGTNRGDNAFAENTLPSFLQGVLEGATMVELDVQHSSDGAVVVMHDDTVNRTTSGEGCVAELTLAEIQALDAGGERVPTLQEVFDAVRVGINIEIKVNDDASCPMTDKPRLAADVAALIAADGGGRRVLVSSFDLEQLLALQAVDDTVPLAYLTTGIDGFDVAIDNLFAAVHPLQVSVRRPDVDRAHAAGLEVNPWTVNDELTIRRLAGMGVDRIITDDPAIVLETIAAYCASLVCDDGGVDAGPDTGPDAADPDAGADATSDDAGASSGGCALARGSTSAATFAALAGVFALLLHRRRR